jgi:hypothetical protein
MAINLSNVTFTDQDDIVPLSGVEQINLAGYYTVNTLAGDDVINGVNDNNIDTVTGNYGFENLLGTLNTNSGNDLIRGIYQTGPYSYGGGASGIINMGNLDPFWDTGFATINTGDGNDTITGIVLNNNNPNVFAETGITNIVGIIDTGDGNDVITGIGDYIGILTETTTIDTGNGDDIITAISEGTGIDARVITTINTGDGNDTITATGGSGWGILLLTGSIDTGGGNDIINGTGDFGGLVFSSDPDGGSESVIDTGEGDDTITGTSSDYAIVNAGTVNTGSGKDSIISHGAFSNNKMFLGEGDDSIIANIDSSGPAIYNYQMIDAGNGKDIITSTGVIYNQGVIETGNSNDSIIADGGFEGLGYVSLGNGKDNLKGFGSGEFSGGNGNDTLELTPGTYTVGKWYTAVTFTKGSSIMIASEFEELIAGSTVYDFTSLTNGQTITVA